MLQESPTAGKQPGKGCYLQQLQEGSGQGTKSAKRPRWETTGQQDCWVGAC